MTQETVTMTRKPVPHAETVLEDSWFVEAAPESEQPPASDPELDTEWFARGRPLSDRPPAP